MISPACLIVKQVDRKSDLWLFSSFCIGKTSPNCYIKRMTHFPERWTKSMHFSASTSGSEGICYQGYVSSSEEQSTCLPCCNPHWRTELPLLHIPYQSDEQKKGQTGYPKMKQPFFCRPSRVHYKSIYGVYSLPYLSCWNSLRRTALQEHLMIQGNLFPQGLLVKVFP